MKSISEEWWGAVNEVWRATYVHFITNGATINSTQPGGPKQALKDAANWMEETKEKMWRERESETGAYINEANPYNNMFVHDFYGTSYTKLLDIKRKYDPSESLFVLAGVESDNTHDSRWHHGIRRLLRSSMVQQKYPRYGPLGLTIAPPFIAATMYMSLGRTIQSLRGNGYAIVSPRWMTWLFVIVHVFCLCTQLAGTGIQASTSESLRDTGLEDPDWRAGLPD